MQYRDPANIRLTHNPGFNIALLTDEVESVCHRLLRSARWCHGVWKRLLIGLRYQKIFRCLRRPVFLGMQSGIAEEPNDVTQA